MRAIFLAFGLQPVAAPAEPAADPQPMAGVVWPSEAKASAARRQRVRAAVAEALGVPTDAVVDAADRAARVALAGAHPREAFLARLDAERGLDEAVASFRAGVLDEAESRATAVLAVVAKSPQLPGSAHVAVRVYHLRAAIEFVRGRPAAVDAALVAALTLDPEGELSARELPPPLVERHRQLQAERRATSSTWSTPKISVRGGRLLGVEIDDEPGLRPVPPGEHYVVAHVEGMEPVGAVLSAEHSLEIDARPRIAMGLPRDRAAATRICEALELEVVVLARAYQDRLGLQAFQCGEGFGARWITAVEGAPLVGSEVLPRGAKDRRFVRARHDLDAPESWPSVELRAAGEPSTPTPQPAPKRPWHKRAWVWTLVGGAVIAGVTAGAVVGTRADPQGASIAFGDFVQRQ